MAGSSSIITKAIVGPFVGTDKNAVALAMMLRLSEISLGYSSNNPNAEAYVRGSHESGYEIFDLNEYGSITGAVKRRNPFAPFKAVFIEGKPDDVLQEKERLALDGRGYEFVSMSNMIGERAVISADRNEKSTSIHAVGGNLLHKDTEGMLERFKAAMGKLGFHGLKEETKEECLQSGSKPVKIPKKTAQAAGKGALQAVKF